jgi:hypothetical protein
LIQLFNKHEVDYILVGGYLVILNGYNRTTGDLDLWIKPTEENYKKLMTSFLDFGLPTTAFSKEDFLDTNRHDVFSFGVSPVSIDFITKVKGLDFDKAYINAKIFNIESDFFVRGLSKSDLIKAKRASGRNKDLDDIEHIS